MTKTTKISPRFLAIGMTLADANDVPFARITAVRIGHVSVRVQTEALDGLPFLPIGFPFGTDANVVVVA